MKIKITWWMVLICFVVGVIVGIVVTGQDCDYVIKTPVVECPEIPVCEQVIDKEDCYALVIEDQNNLETLKGLLGRKNE